MNVQSLNPSGGVRRVVAAFLLGVVTGTACVQPSLAQQFSSQSVVFADPLKQLNWISGPQNITIGDFAKVTIPDGYRFTDARGARVILENANTPVPNDLVGVLADKAGTWWAVLQYDKTGYIKSTDLAKIDSGSVLKEVQKQLQSQDNAAGVTSLAWKSQPAFDAQSGSLAWALQVSASSARTLKEGVALLGRHGILEVTAARAYPLATAPALNQIVAKNISFQPGERYADYQNGDKTGPIELAGLVSGDNSGNATNAPGTATWVYWVYAGLVVCLGCAGFMVLSSRKKNRNRLVQAPVSGPAAAQAATVAQAASIAPVTSTANGHVPLTTVKLNGNGHHSKANGSNGAASGRNGKHFHRNRRKRMFDYPKFYTHVMKELSFHAYEASPTANGKARNGNSYANGHVNGLANTNGANGHTNGTNGTNGANGLQENGSVKSGIEELIATQKALIHEQKCLLEQQTRLIEEKRWLIEEQTAFLKGQAGMINDQQFPLKFE